MWVQRAKACFLNVVQQQVWQWSTIYLQCLSNLSPTLLVALLSHEIVLAVGLHKRSKCFSISFRSPFIPEAITQTTNTTRRLFIFTLLKLQLSLNFFFFFFGNLTRAFIFLWQVNLTEMLWCWSMNMVQYQQFTYYHCDDNSLKNSFLFFPFLFFFLHLFRRLLG